MCPMLSVLLATLKMGSCDVTSFSIVCTMRFKTSRPRPPQLQCLHRSDQSHVPRTATNIEIEGRGRFLNMPTGGLSIIACGCTR